MKTKPEITDEEIRGYMDFDKLVAQHEAAGLKTKRANKIATIISSVVLLTGAVITSYFLMSDSPEAMAIKAPKPEEIQPIPSEQQTKIQSTEKTEPTSKQATIEAKKENDPAITVTTPTSNSAEMTSIYNEAEPVAGFPHLYEYFNSELRYPIEAMKDSIQGIETVSFVINAEGKPVEIKVVQSLGEGFDKEARRLIEQMPAWKPAQMNGKPVKARISIPLNFRIEKIRK